MRFEDTELCIFVLKGLLEKSFNPLLILKFKKHTLEILNEEWPGGFHHAHFDKAGTLEVLHKSGAAIKFTGKVSPLCDDDLEWIARLAERKQLC